MELADAERHLTKTYQYSVTGELTYGSAVYENEYTYNGESYNPNIHSQYLRARYYSVVTANFITEDSCLGRIQEPLTLNRYNYCISSYLNYVDPSGNDPDYMNPAEAMEYMYWLTGDKMFNYPVPQIPLDAVDNYLAEKAAAVWNMENYYTGRCAGDILVTAVNLAESVYGIYNIFNGPKNVSPWTRLSSNRLFAYPNGKVREVTQSLVAGRALEAGRSVLAGVLACDALNDFQDSGSKIGRDKENTGVSLGINKERVNFGQIIGQIIDPDTGVGEDTTIGIIHYGKKRRISCLLDPIRR